MPRVQIFVSPELYPVADTDRTDKQMRVADFLSGFPGFIAQTFGVPEERVRLFAAPRGEFDRSPVDVDITASIKIAPEGGLDAPNDALKQFAAEQLGEGMSVGSHLYVLAEDAWTTTLG